MDILSFLGDLPSYFGPEIAALMGLITLDILMGIGKALRTKSFRWSEIANFYQSMVIPYLLGWLGFAALAHVAMPSVLGSEFGVIAETTTVTGAWLAVVGALFNSIKENAKVIYSGKFPWQD